MRIPCCRLALLCLVLLACGPTAFSGGKPAPVPEVPVARPVVREVADYEDFTGRVNAVEQVDLRARVTGYVDAVPFKEGERVKQGDVLFEIDPRPYKAELNRVASQVDLAKATLQLARTALARSQVIAKSAPGAISQQQLDMDQAAVTEATARLRAAEATVDLAKLNLAFCKVSAPINGRIGRCLVTRGNLVEADKTQLATLVSEDPMYVYFDIDERTYLRLRRAEGAAKAQAGATQIAVGLADEEKFPHRGVVDFVNNQVDVDTGTIRLRATLPNKNRLMRPGMFVRVRVPMGAPYRAVLVSDRAVLSDDIGTRYVYVIDADNKVHARHVRTGPLQTDGLRVISEGLRPDDRIVIGQLRRVRPGMRVRPVETKMPEAQPAPSSQEPSPARGQAGSGIRVDAFYPGANAKIVSDTVRFPIEQQVSGMENIRYMRSRCTNDGRYALEVAFARGTDLLHAQVLVQNRVALAVPQLPAAVSDAGVNVKRGTAGMLMIVTVSSTDRHFDALFLGNYANVHVKDELARAAGVSEVALIGGSGDFGLRVWVNADRLAAYNLNLADVTRVLRQEKQGGAADPEKIAQLIVKTAGEGQVVRLRDIAKVELGRQGSHSEAYQRGMPVVAACVYLTHEASPRTVRAALEDRLRGLREELPKGLRLDVAFDFTANFPALFKAEGADGVLVDLDIASTSADRTDEVLTRGEALLGELPAVKHVLALSENPFDVFGGPPCLLVMLKPAAPGKADRAEVLKEIRKPLAELKDVTVRLRDLSAPGRFPRCGYPIDIALRGPESADVREWATRLGERLERSDKLTDVWVSTASVPRPSRFVEIDRQAAATRGVALDDIFTTMEAYAGAVTVNPFNFFGRMVRVEVKISPQGGDWAKGLASLKIRNARGQMIPLGTFVTVREVEQPQALDFLDIFPMVEVTASPAPGVSVADAQKHCAALADEVRRELGLRPEYRVIWLQEKAKR